jgi:hypothetical protein
VDIQLGGDLGAVDDEGLLELILQLEQFPDGRVDDPETAQKEGWGAAKLGLGLASELVDGVDELAGGPVLESLGRCQTSPGASGCSPSGARPSPMSGM